MTIQNSDTFYSSNLFQDYFKNSTQSFLCKANLPDFTILAVSDLGVSLAGIAREHILGQKTFDVFPGIKNEKSDRLSVEASFEYVIKNKKADRVPHLHYDVPISSAQPNEVMYWEHLNEPLFDGAGNVAYLINTSVKPTNRILTEQQDALSVYDQHQSLENEQVLNEELTAANEELADTNDELIRTQQQLVEQTIKLATINEDLRQTQDCLRFSLNELSESEAKYRSLIEQSPIAQQVFRGQDMTLELVNETMLQFLGKKPDIIGKPLFKAVPEIVGQPIVEHLYEVYRTGTPLELNEEKVTLHRNGRDETGWYNVSYRALQEDGCITGILGIAIDVTQQVLARQALEESENRFRSLIENSPAAMLVFRGENLIFETVNGAMLKILDKGPGIIGKPLLEGLPEFKGQPIVEIIKEVYRTGVPYTTEGIAIELYRNGKLETGYFNSTYRPMYENGLVTSILQAAVEVTDLFKAHQAMRESEVRFRIMAEASGIMIGLGDETGNIIYFNQAWTDLTGKSMEDLVAFGWTELIHPDDKEAYVNLYLDSLKQRLPYTGEYRILSKTGEYRWLLAYVSPYFKEDNFFAGYIGSFIDITERKQDDQRKNDFIGMVSHELKTPLTTINGYLQILKLRAKKVEDQLSIAMFDKTVQQVRKMTSMINGFLNVSRLESGKIQIDRQRFDMALLIKEAEDECMITISSHRVIFAPVKQIWVNADRDKIAHVISNLVGNAIKYSPIGSTINVACVTRMDMAVFSVQDHGMGVAIEDLPKLFERYYRVKGVQATTVSGFGIGLYLCSEIVKRHSGRTWAESEPGIGSTFYFSLPTVI